MSGICYHDFTTNNLPTSLYRILLRYICEVWRQQWFCCVSLAEHGSIILSLGSTGDLLECMEVLPEEKPWAVPYTRPWYQRAPL